jgi:hypothetical protein
VEDDGVSYKVGRRFGLAMIPPSPLAGFDIHTLEEKKRRKMLPFFLRQD